MAILCAKIGEFFRFYNMDFSFQKKMMCYFFFSEKILVFAKKDVTLRVKNQLASDLCVSSGRKWWFYFFLI